MKDMPVINTIRDMYRKGESVSQIARTLKVDRKTVSQVPQRKRLLAKTTCCKGVQKHYRSVY